MAPSIIEEHVDFQPPAGDGWTSSPELPTADEIMRSQEENAIPSNDVRKPWATKDKYLEAQYKILRCEAVEGLRFSVKQYKESRCLKDDKLTCVYTTVSLMVFPTLHEKEAYQFRFSSEAICSAGWARSSGSFSPLNDLNIESTGNYPNA